MLFDLFVVPERSVGIERHIVTGKQIGSPGLISGFGVCCIGHLFNGKAYEFLAVLGLLGYKAPSKAGGPAILIVKPCQHFFCLGFFVACPDQLHKFFAEILGSHPGTRVHVKAPKAHCLQLLDLPKKLILLQLCVPGPERSPAVFRGGIFKQLLFQPWIRFPLIQHFVYPFLNFL